jgi:hypothetical protein
MVHQPTPPKTCFSAPGTLPKTHQFIYVLKTLSLEFFGTSAGINHIEQRFSPSSQPENIPKSQTNEKGKIATIAFVFRVTFLSI